MRRREIIALVGGAAVWPLAARGQTPAKGPLVGFLSAVSRERNTRMTTAFAQGLRELGFAEGRDIEVAYRFAEGHLDRLPQLAQEMVELHPSVILAAVTP